MQCLPSNKSLIILVMLLMASRLTACLPFDQSHRRPDRFDLSITVLGDCRATNLMKSEKAKASLKCGVPNAELIFFNTWGAEVYRTVTNTDGSFSIRGKTVVDDKLGKAVQLRLKSNMCREKNYPIRIGRTKLYAKGWFSHFENYAYDAHEIVECELTSSYKKKVETVW